MTQTTHLALPFIEAAQAQKHVTHNEALTLIDVLAHLSVAARDVTAPPATLVEGDRLLIGASATGAFAGKSDQIATFLAGDWTFLAPQAGWRAYVEAESLLLLYDGAGWNDLGLSLHELQNLTQLGVGTAADAANPLSAKINAALFAAKAIAEGGTGDLRFTLNKESAAKTASQLYQTNYSGRAETGLTGDDDFRVKVSPDGASWKEAIVVDRTTGEVAFPSGGPTKILSFTSSGTYTPTPGMRFIDILLFGAGGGGGSGARTASGAAASGGAGGGGGGMARGRFTAAQLGPSKAVTIGAAGLGGAAQTTNSTNGNDGTGGGATAFGALLYAGGGGGGAGGQIGAASGGGGGGSVGSGANGSGSTAGAQSLGAGGGGSGVAGGTAGHFYSGAGGGGCSATGATAAEGGGCLYNGPSGGGAGGGITAGNTPGNGGAGGIMFVAGAIPSAAGGSAGGAKNGGAGGAWASGVGPMEQAGGGGGGGAADLTAPGNGGAGGFPGGGGGGGGTAQNGANSEAGGAGGAGYAIIVEFF